MDEVRDDPWLVNGQSKLKKQLSLPHESDHIIEDDIIEDKPKSNANKLRQIVGNFNKINEQ